MNAEAAVEALKALHVKTRWTWAVEWGMDDVRDGCRVCGGSTRNSCFWPCETRAILDRVEAHDE